MNVKAVAKGVGISPRKVNPVAALVRDRSVADAIIILDHTPRRASMAVKKVIESARANADYNHRLKPETLRIVEISISAGPRLKRFRPVSRGMAHPYLHQTSHIRVVLDGEARPAKKPAAVTNADKAEEKK